MIYYSSHLHFTPALWREYVVNALKTEPPSMGALCNWGVLNAQLEAERPVFKDAVLALGPHTTDWRVLGFNMTPTRDNIERPMEPLPCVDLAPLTNVLRALHAAHGMSTELAELRRAPNEDNAAEETADLCWYSALLYITLFTVDAEFDALVDLVRTETPTSPTDIYTLGEAVISDLKRTVWYNNKKPEVALRLRNNYVRLLLCIDATAQDMTSVQSMALLLRRNSEKLLDQRYAQGKFTEKAATDRADKAGADEV